MSVKYENTPDVGVSWHECANVFPMLEGKAQEALVRDIKQHGVREPIVFLDGQILDGRNRYMAARGLGIAYPRREFGSDPADGADPLAFVVSHNLTRRHLSEHQRSMVAAKAAKLKAGRPEKSANLRNNLTQQEAAEMLNVSRRSVQTARKVQETAEPEIVAAVEAGRLSVSAAANIADTLSPEEQRAAAQNDDALRGGKVEAKERKARPPVVTLNTGKTEWYTPVAILDAARTVLGSFDLDPASSIEANKAVGAAQIFTETDDGLAADWPMGRIWMNPPYAANLVGKFVTKYCEAMRAGSTGCALVNNATETGWFHELLSVSDAVCFPKGRLRFVCQDKGDSGTPLQGQAIFYSGSNASEFHRTFAAFGHILTSYADA